MGNNKQLHKVEKINSRVETGDVETNVVKFLEEKSAIMTGKIFILAHKHHEVLIGEVRDGKVDIDTPEQLSHDYLQELRMFSLSGELYIWNRNSQLKYRWRIDEQGEITSRYDEEHFMWGLNKDASGGSEPFWKRVPTPPKTFGDNTVIEPNRGMRLTFPFPVAENDCPLKYRVRNYLEFDDHGHLHFYDARLITFLNKNGKEMKS